MVTDQLTRMMYQTWNVRNPKAVLLLVHGLGGHAARWEFWADFFIKNDFSSYALELEGFGVTSGRRGHIDSFDTYYKHIQRLYQIIKTENPDKLVFIAGESLGALIAFLMVIKHKDFFAGLVCLSPAFKDKLKLSVWFQLRVYIDLIFFPSKQFQIPFNLQMCCRDIEYCSKMENDKREHRLASARMLWEIVSGQFKAKIWEKKATLPVLFLLSGQDKMVDPQESERVFAGLSSPGNKIITYPQMSHALSIDIGREKVFADIFEWVLSELTSQV
jgi:alpha-beta hydrolase superfamily lysophospholipase